MASEAPPAATAPVAPVPNAAIEAEGEDYDENDSAFGSSIASSTASISSSILRYRQENGRTYHAYNEGKYVLPNDEVESDRLDLQHHLFTLTFDNKLHVCPIPKEKALNRVLDIGTGTGIWAIDFADEHPESQVIGVDLSPIQPLFVPPNLKFEVDDVEEHWTFPYKFDFIYSRMMTSSLADWPKLFAQSYEMLTPGGWMEVADICLPAQSDDDTLPVDSKLKKWCDLILTGSSKIGRGSDTAVHYKEQMIAAGFDDVVQIVYKWPTNQWPKNKKMKELGMWVNEDIAGGLSGLSMALFTRILGWTPEELEVFLVDVRKEMKNTKIHAYFPIYVVYGRKSEAVKASD